MKLKSVVVDHAKGEVSVFTDGAAITISTQPSDDFLVAVNRHAGAGDTEVIPKKAPKAKRT